MGSHKKHKYYKKTSKKSKKHKKKSSLNLNKIRDKLKNDRKYSTLISSLSIKDKKNPIEKRSRSVSSDSSNSPTAGRRKIKYKYKKSRSSSVTSSSSSTSSIVSSSSSSSQSSLSSSDERRKLKHKKKKLKKDDKKKKIEILNKKYEETKKQKSEDSKKNSDNFNYDKKRIKKIKLSNDGPGPSVPDSILQKSKTMAPMSREEYEKKQSEIRRVYDQETGRYRLIKGDGEVLEEIVSRSRHREINKQATMGDGNFFQSTLNSQLKNK